MLNGENLSRITKGESVTLKQDSRYALSNRYLIACHQAGKAISGVLAGCPPRSVELERNGSGGVKGYCRFDRESFESLEVSERIAILLGSHVGGRIGRAKRIVRPSGADLWGLEREDFEIVRKILDDSYAGEVHKDPKCPRSREMFGKTIEVQAWQTLVLRMRSEWASTAVSSLAFRLDIDGKLDGKILSQALELLNPIGSWEQISNIGADSTSQFYRFSRAQTFTGEMKI